MKHSRRVALVLLGSVSALTLTACNEETPRDGDPIYESTDQCRVLGGTQCDERWQHAVSDHVKTAPRYNSQESCLQQGHPNCTPVNVGGGGGSIWLPAIAGFMAGRGTSLTRPVYLQGYNNPQNDREREDRRVMAGGYHGGTTTPVMVGNYWAGGGSTNSASPTLSQGMNAGAARAGWSATAGNPNGVAVSQAGTVASRAPANVSRAGVSASSASTSSAARGGFGGSGASMGSSGG